MIEVGGVQWMESDGLPHVSGASEPSPRLVSDTGWENLYLLSWRST
jgi:hypothetical protein